MRSLKIYTSDSHSNITSPGLVCVLAVKSLLQDFQTHRWRGWGAPLHTWLAGICSPVVWRWRNQSWSPGRRPCESQLNASVRTKGSVKGFGGQTQKYMWWGGVDPPPLLTSVATDGWPQKVFYHWHHSGAVHDPELNFGPSRQSLIDLLFEKFPPKKFRFVLVDNFLEEDVDLRTHRNQIDWFFWKKKRLQTVSIYRTGIFCSVLRETHFSWNYSTTQVRHKWEQSLQRICCDQW